jgi:hypothetical protein
MEGTRSFLQLRRAVRVQGRRVIARFLTKPHRGAVLTFPTHGDARRAAAKLLVQLRLAKTDEEWDEQLIFRVDFLSAYNALVEEDEGQKK